MSRLDHVVDEGRFRAVADPTLNGVAGTWGTTFTSGGNDYGDLFCVQVGPTGTLIAATADACDGVIWVTEGMRDSHRQTAVDRHIIQGGKTYTVFERAIIAEMETGDDPLAAGDRVFSAAAGGISSSPAGRYIGVAVPNPVTGGVRIIVRVGANPGDVS